METRIVAVDLDYATVGPRYGSKVEEINAALEAGDFDIQDEILHVAGEHLGSDLFEIHEEHHYSGDGNLLRTENAIVIVR